MSKLKRTELDFNMEILFIRIFILEIGRTAAVSPSTEGFIQPASEFQVTTFFIYCLVWLPINLLLVTVHQAEKIMLLLIIRPLPRDGGVAEDHGTPEEKIIARFLLQHDSVIPRFERIVKGRSIIAITYAALTLSITLPTSSGNNAHCY